MKKLIIISQMLLFAGLSSFAQSNNAKRVELESQVNSLKVEIGALKQVQKATNNQISVLLHTVDIQSQRIDSLRNDLSKANDELRQTSTNMKRDISATNETISSTEKAMSSAINKKSVYAGLVGFLALILAVVIFFIHKKRVAQSSLELDCVDKRISSLKDEQQKLQDNIVASNDKLISAIEKQAAAVNTQNATAEVDHSLALAVANELTRIQQNLNFMDPTVKGVSQLKNRVKAILTTLNSKQYEIPDLLGKVYHEGDNMIATMELNEDLEVGTNRIKRVIKPQVSYKGKMIQAAQVVVEFNE